ncbi:hypothetical protein QE152_g27336 [Popillia japonica]|uniref:GIY-YIG homing endonuclease n=1 Tax=Popillia japonica TaxID=7064 RepID=A0AAW1JV92_POPJA
MNWKKIFKYEKDSIPNELRTHSLNIFDDAHKKNGITDLAEKIFTEGRHRQQHIIYIQQTGTFIPAGMKSREYKNRLKAVGRNTEDKNDIRNTDVIYKAYKNAGADGAKKTDIISDNDVQQLFKVL